MVAEKTLPTLLAERAKREPKGIALRQKHLGIWNEITWGDYLENVEKLAISLSEQYNIKNEETVAIIGENRPQWFYAEMASSKFRSHCGWYLSRIVTRSN